MQLLNAPATKLGRYVNRHHADDEECGGCGLLYVRDSPTDRRLHRSYHGRRVRSWSLPPRPLRPTDPVIMTTPQIVVAVRGTTAAVWQARAAGAARLAAEMVYDTALFSDHWTACRRRTAAGTLALVAFDPRHRRATGLLIVEPVAQVWAATWRAEPPPARNDIPLLAGNAWFDIPAKTPQPAVHWAVMLVWVHPSARRQGLATRLLHAAVVQLEPAVSVTALAWQHPFSLDGAAFARRQSPAGVLVA